ncbi:hypothetical protein TWF788_007255 [Orbilia oligospora]|uniref:Uncharacterized protein n=1 Tax=Orbilia oligospora TaxID=2813651 RepID=A0A7C8R540_ORBOL|nr:hypothetical protein TWF788_007255 [Orbilia oligospora]KAF3229861.1 hypothetical protein TWF191_000769 [Orbilia oligospora]
MHARTGIRVHGIWALESPSREQLIAIQVPEVSVLPGLIGELYSGGSAVSGLLCAHIMVRNPNGRTEE